MNWDAVGAVAELLGALGVIITVAYLALQIRQNTKAMRSAAHQTMFDDIHSVQLALSQDPELAKLYLKGNEAYDSLTGEEEIRYGAFAGLLLGEWENVFYQNQQSSVAPEMWKAWDSAYREIYKQPSVRRVWADRRFQYLESFREHVEGGDKSSLD